MNNYGFVIGSIYCYKNNSIINDTVIFLSSFSFMIDSCLTCSQQGRLLTHFTNKGSQLANSSITLSQNQKMASLIFNSSLIH